MRIGLSLICLALASCQSSIDLLQDYEEVTAVTDIRAPEPDIQRLPELDADAVAHGAYLVELLGCGSCHTDGALVGQPNRERLLAGSRIGIAYTNPLDSDYPGIVYPRNLTPDRETGIGAWSAEQIKAAITHGRGPAGQRRSAVMPWRSFARLSNTDLDALAAYLKSLPAVRHRVPTNVPEGARASEPFIHFGVYRSRGTP